MVGSKVHSEVVSRILDDVNRELIRQRMFDLKVEIRELTAMADYATKTIAASNKELELLEAIIVAGEVDDDGSVAAAVG